MIIKCPECGHQVSDKAPSCPTCGVQIAGKVCQCQNCGEVYFNDQELCPACHQINSQSKTQYRTASPAQPAQPVRPAQPAQPAQPANGANPQPEAPKKKSNKATLVIAFIFAAIICGGLFYLYQKNSSDNEQQEYEYAMRSNDEEILKQYLAQFPDAPQEHLDSIKAHLERMNQGDIDWQNAVLSNSRNALQEYLDKNPNSPHRQEAMNKIDSLDWTYASKDESLEELEKYLTDHPNGSYIDDAKAAIEKLKSNTIQDFESQTVKGVVRRFFMSINTRNEAGMVSTVSPSMDKFLTKTNATADDIRQFLQQNYKDGVTNVNWHIDASTYDIQKRQVLDDQYAYDATFDASRDTETASGTTTDKFAVSVTVDNTGKISSMSISRR